MKNLIIKLYLELKGSNPKYKQYFFLDITKWTSVQYFQITSAEFVGGGAFVLGTIELVGGSPYAQTPNTTYVEPGYNIINASGDDVSSEYTVVTVSGTVDVNTLADYTLTYTATHVNSNLSIWK